MIIAAGDSFIFGNELTDCPDGITASTSTWPCLLAKSQDMECLNVAVAGAGNEAIARNTINACETSKGIKHAVVVQWTFPNRYEFYFDFPTGQRSPWYTIGAWHVADVNEIQKEFHSDNPDILQQQRDHINRAKDSGVTAFATEYFKKVGGTEYWETYNTLKQIVYLQNYLMANKIPFLFAFSDSIIFYNSILRTPDVNIRSLHNQIQLDTIYKFPSGTQNWETIGPRGFYQWAVENKYSMGTTHPLEQAHQDAAKLIQGKFNEMVEKLVQ